MWGIVISNLFRHRMGFTLAEVLITLGIIGVVAAMTIPVLTNKTQDLEFRSSWKKQYSALSQVLLQVMDENGGSLLGVFQDRNAISTNLAPYLKSTKICAANASGCFHSSGQWYDGNKAVLAWGYQNIASVVLPDGALIGFDSGTSGDVPTCTNIPDNNCFDLVVDVNGFKLPNQVGKDIYTMTVFPTVVKPTGYNFANGCSNSFVANDCSAAILRK